MRYRPFPTLYQANAVNRLALHIIYGSDPPRITLDFAEVHAAGNGRCPLIDRQEATRPSQGLSGAKPLTRICCQDYGSDDNIDAAKALPGDASIFCLLSDKGHRDSCIALSLLQSEYCGCKRFDLRVGQNPVQIGFRLFDQLVIGHRLRRPGVALRIFGKAAKFPAWPGPDHDLSRQAPEEAVAGCRSTRIAPQSWLTS